MAGMYLKALNGVEGEVTIPSIGATIGTTSKWFLSRRDDRHGETGVYIFRAAFSYLNLGLFREDSLNKEIRVRVGKEGKWFRVQRQPGSPIQFYGDDQFVMDEVVLWPVEED
jgi:hypothetical protein